ncbi:MAG: fused MFS/spermidine synthase, partial [Candidatus Omnitrophica bacterium]|nr:fused MFS/spermidine synthase [Candidatus Omnitrophota bacterium]
MPRTISNNLPAPFAGKKSPVSGNNRYPVNRALRVSLITIGVTALSGQIILIREFFTIFYGNELSIGLVLFLWLLGGSTGAYCGGKSAAIVRDRGFSTVIAGHLLVSLALPAALIIVRLARCIFGIPLGEMPGIPVMMAAGIMSFFPLNFILGFMFVCAAKEHAVEADTGRIASAYFFESLGAVAGGIITGIALVRYFNNFTVAWMCGAVNAVIAFAAAGMAGVVQRRWRVAAGIVGIAFLGMTVTGIQKMIDRYTIERKWQGVTLLASRDSLYGNVSITALNRQYTVFSNGLIASSAPDPLTAEESVHFAMLNCPLPQDVLVIGGGIGDAIQEILKYPVHEIDYVELDPLIIRLARRYLSGQAFFRLNDRRVRCVEADARFFLKTTDRMYDVVIMNLPGPSTAQINRLYTREFYEELARHLKPAGIFSFPVASSENYRSEER